MIPRACYGSLERFLGIIIENYAAKFPLWLAPVQIEVLPVSEKYNDYAKKVAAKLADDGLRVETNLRDDRIGYKIRQSSLHKIPYAIIVGEKEASAESINVRSRDDGELGEMSLKDFLKSIEVTRNPPTLDPAAAKAEAA